MLIINNEIDLGKSFEKLKKNLKDISNEVEDSDHPARYAHAFGRVTMAIKIHLIECSGDETLEGLQKYIADQNTKP